MIRWAGRPVGEVIDEAMARSSGANADNLRVAAVRRHLQPLAGPVTLGVRSATGEEREVVVEPRPAGLWDVLDIGLEARGPGFLTDLGAPTIYYVSVGGETLASHVDFIGHLEGAAAGGATGLVVDVRGYPTRVRHYSVMQALAEGRFRSPRFDTPTWTGPDRPGLALHQSELDESPRIPLTIPVALLVSPVTVSAAETFSLMVEDHLAPVVVGRRSAGTNGNVTGVQLPGGFYFRFTGMRTQRPGGGLFHGVGVAPDVEVTPTVAELAAGRDPELEAAARR